MPPKFVSSEADCSDASEEDEVMPEGDAEEEGLIDDAEVEEGIPSDDEIEYASQQQNEAEGGGSQAAPLHSAGRAETFDELMGTTMAPVAQHQPLHHTVGDGTNLTDNAGHSIEETKKLTEELSKRLAEQAANSRLGRLAKSIEEFIATDADERELDKILDVLEDKFLDLRNQRRLDPRDINPIMRCAEALYFGEVEDEHDPTMQLWSDMFGMPPASVVSYSSPGGDGGGPSSPTANTIRQCTLCSVDKTALIVEASDVILRHFCLVAGWVNLRETRAKTYGGSLDHIRKVLYGARGMLISTSEMYNILNQLPLNKASFRQLPPPQQATGGGGAGDADEPEEDEDGRPLRKRRKENLKDKHDNFYYKPRTYLPLADRLVRPTKFQKFMEEVLSLFLQRGWRKWNDKVMQPISIVDQETQQCLFLPVYEIVGDIEENVRSLYHTHYRPHLMEWSQPQTRNVDQVVKWLRVHEDGIHFKTIRRERTLFCFTDVAYDCRKDKATPHTESLGGRTCCKYHPFFVAEYAQVQADDELNPGWAGQIPTPAFDQVLLYQLTGREDAKVGNLKPDEYDCYLTVLAVFGRMFYDVNDLDKWKILLFLWGYTGTGKSSLLIDFLHRVYDDRDIADLSNNRESTFGLGVHAKKGKIMMLASDVTKEMSKRFDQGELLQIPCGEYMSCAIKNDDPWSGVWTAPVAMAGNTFPAWDNSKGEISRRFFVITCMRRPRARDSGLGERIQQEVGKLIIKCNKAYHHCLKKHGRDVEFWSWCPKKLIDGRDQVMKKMSALDSFLDESGHCSIGTGFEFECDLPSFRHRFTEYCRNTQRPLPQLDHDYFNLCFESRGNIELVRERDHMTAKDVIKGIKLLSVENVSTL